MKWPTKIEWPQDIYPSQSPLGIMPALNSQNPAKKTHQTIVLYNFIYKTFL
jgi:hypothetical protein